MSDFLRAVYVAGAPGLDPVDRALSDQERGWRRAVSAGSFGGTDVRFADEVLVELCSAARPLLALKEAPASGGRLRLPALKPQASSKNDTGVDGKIEDVKSNTKEPAADTKKPAADTKKPAADTKEPAADTKEPAADTKEPAADTKEPAAEEPDSDAEEETADSAADAALDTGDSGAARLPFVTSYSEFKRNMDVLTFGLVESTIRDLPLVVAGGSVLAGLQLWPSVHPPAKATLPYILGGKTVHFTTKESNEPKPEADANALSIGSASDCSAEAKAGPPAPSHPAIRKSVIVPADPLPLKFARIYAAGGVNLCNCPIICKKYNKCSVHRRVRADEEPMSARDELVLGQHAFLADTFWDEWGCMHDAGAGSVTRKSQNLNLEIMTLVDPYVARLLPDCFPAAVAALCAGYVAVDAREFFLSPRGAALSNFRDADVDLFFVGADAAGALAAIAECHKRITAVVGPFFTMRSECATTFLLPPPYRKIQIVHRLHSSVAHVLVGFDLECCALAWHRGRLLATPRAARALATRCVVADPTRQSTSYEVRLAKYMKRGFEVSLGLNNSATDLGLNNSATDLGLNNSASSAPSDLARHVAEARRLLDRQQLSDIGSLAGLQRLFAILILHARWLAGHGPAGNGHSNVTEFLGVTPEACDYGPHLTRGWRYIMNPFNFVNSSRNVATIAFGLDINKVLSKNTFARLTLLEQVWYYKEPIEYRFRHTVVADDGKISYKLATVDKKFKSTVKTPIAFHGLNHCVVDGVRMYSGTFRPTFGDWFNPPVYVA